MDGRIQKPQESSPANDTGSKKGRKKKQAMVIPQCDDAAEGLRDAIQKQEMDKDQALAQLLKPPPMRRICACGSLTCPDGPWYGWMWIRASSY